MMTASDSDPEIEAIKTLLDVLGPLKPDQRDNVLTFVFRKLGIERHVEPHRAAATSAENFEDAPTARTQPVPLPTRSAEPTDIRSLKEKKQPKTTNEMVAIVAYYLEHLAKDDERRDYITANDIAPYFKQSGFKLPTSAPSMTLAHAKHAGYLKATGTRGRYRLNPVGYNLVAYKMPTGGTAAGPKRKQ